MIDNEQIKNQLKHRSIRFFKDQEVEEEVLDTIFAVGQRTATSVGMQAVSIVRLTDQDLKDKVMTVAKQPYIAKAPELFIFVVDLYRNMKIAHEKGSEVEAPTMNHFFQGAADAYLMAQNMMTAIETLGLGGTFLGNILSDPEAVIESLELPQYTFPILGMILGYPDDDPQLKPRLPMELRVSNNTYQTYDNYLEEIADYEEQSILYYDTRESNKRSDSFSKQVCQHMETHSVNRDEILKFIEKQGFDLGL